MTLDEMYARNGLYKISFSQAGDSYCYFYARVIDGVCYQLVPETFKLDGVLSRDGWRPDILHEIKWLNE